MAKKKESIYKRYQGKERMSVYVPPEVKKQVVKYAEQFGLSQTGMASMCISAGLNKIIMAVEPQKLFTPELIQEMGKLQEKMEKEKE